MYGFPEERMSDEHYKWLLKTLAPYDCIYIGVHGSTLYGLDSEKSDLDFKVVYMPSKRDLLLGNAKKTYQKKNQELNIEVEIKSLSCFLNDASHCDTNCFDLLHTPDEMILHDNLVWRQLRSYRHSLYAKNMKGLIGYIKTHTHKYSNKIERLNEMKRVIKYAQNVDYDLRPKYTTVGDLAEDLNWEDFKYVKVVSLVKDHEQKYLEVCGKKYIYTWSIKDLVSKLVHEVDRYGKRSNEGLAAGMDTKSLSHAIRVLFQMKEVVETNHLVFPLRDAEYIKSVKYGKVPVDEVISKIDSLYDEVMDALENSELKEEVDLEPMYEILENYYFKGD